MGRFLQRVEKPTTTAIFRINEGNRYWICTRPSTMRVSRKTSRILKRHKLFL
uniref:Uncharacterized protein n=1 Tax=Brassica oleracea TaxID=3712 RepID=A0A3P6BZG0_BRAOL|nr:unnamed protein product [Brassica oleracea]